MARIILVLLFLPFNCFASRSLLIINQNDYSFKVDATLWQDFFMKMYPGIQVYRCETYHATEVRLIFNKIIDLQKPHDTLIIVATAHMSPNEYGDTGMKGCLILDASNGIPDLETQVIWQSSIESWINELDQNGIRSLFLLISCKPYLLISPEFASALQYVTIIYATNKDYCIYDNHKGSLLFQAFNKHITVSLFDCITKIKADWLNPVYYQFNDKSTGAFGMSLYPISPVLYGPNFYF